MNLNVSRAGHYLQNGELQKLFVEELGWDRHSATLPIAVDGQTYTLRAIAEKRGVTILECPPDGGGIPVYSVRRKIDKQVTRSAYEHLIIFRDAANGTQVWQWVARQPGQPAAYREHTYARTQSGDALIQKLGAITIPVAEDEAIDLTGAVHLLRDAFDRDRVTKKFYDHFKREHAGFLEFVQGITNQADREWYASLMLNRLMFVYFIQKKGFLDGHTGYLRDRLEKVQERKGSGKFQTFYRYFLLCLFHQGLSCQPPRKASKNLTELLGNVPYLNGGLFDVHELETRYDKIDVPDKAFERLFDFFDQYDWHLDTRPLRNDREINPDVLGYIFEKYINQKQMGAYYTKEDITDYISKNTIIPHLFDVAQKKCAVAFEPGSAVWRQLTDNPDRYLYPSVRHGVLDDQGEVMPLPTAIQKGVEDIGQRDGWNRAAASEFGLPTETWREHAARRQRCLTLRERLLSGQVSQVNDLITYNLDIRQFAEDTIASREGPELLRALYQAVSTVTVLDPTCGSGAFLFAALNVLQPLYEACLDRMQAFVDDLDRSGETHSPKKFEDFRRVLANVARHPNRDYFILKSIIVNNLYGVDIMREAVEICKLRLFLKLVAQVEARPAQENYGLEPLPDIDFNIRPGNTLVGFATLDDAKKAMAGRLDFESDLQRIAEEAEIVDRAFQKFHEMQTAFSMDGKMFADAKQELRRRLDHLAQELDRYLAGQYGVEPDKPRKYAEWLASHQPFHWFAEFYGIMSRGGFDVIIGNPPYVEYSKVKKEYTLRGFRTEYCGNLYAFVLECSAKIAKVGGYLGFIVPLSFASTERMRPIQRVYMNRSCPLWLSHYDVYPCKLFEGAKQRLTILLTGGQSRSTIYTTRYLRWRGEERDHLLDVIQYGRTEYVAALGVFPKLPGEITQSILNKVGSKRQASFLEAGTSPSFYVHRIPYNYIKAMDFAPYFWSEVDGKKKSEDYKPYRTANPEDAKPLVAVLNSNLFFWWWYAFFEGYHCGKHEIYAFSTGLDEISTDVRRRLIALADRLMKDLVAKKNRKQCQYRNTGRVEYDEFFPRLSKPIIDEIDRSLARHYGLSAEELDYIVNYDIKYRLGQKEAEDDE